MGSHYIVVSGKNSVLKLQCGKVGAILPRPCFIIVASRRDICTIVCAALSAKEILHLDSRLGNC